MAADEVDINLRPPDVVGARCIVLTALLRRVWIEASVSAGLAGDWAGEAFDYREWLRTEGLWDSLTAGEQRALVCAPGEFREPELSAAAWQAEGLGTLGWALGLADRLPPGDLSDVATVVAAVPAPWDQTSDWLSEQVLRPEDLVARERDRAELYEWRISIEEPRRAATGTERSRNASIIREVSAEAAAADLLESPGAGDFTIGGRALASYTLDDLEKLSALTEERLRALNWLCGFGTSWDDVPLDV
jgi:hypothetical protein